MTWLERTKIIVLIVVIGFMSAFGVYGCLADAERKMDALHAKKQLKEALDESIKEHRLRALERTQEHMAIQARLDRIEKFLGIKKQ